MAHSAYAEHSAGTEHSACLEQQACVEQSACLEQQTRLEQQARVENPAAGERANTAVRSIQLELTADTSPASSPRRWACVDLPAFAVQLTLRAQPTWRRMPLVILDREGPTGTVIARNVHARRAGVELGMRYTAGLVLCTRLRARAVPWSELEQGAREVLELLRRFSPAVEPSREQPGTFWLDPHGLERLHGSLESWGQAVRDALKLEHWRSAVVVGWRRFECTALAKAARGSNAVLVTADAESERAAAREVQLTHFVRDPLARRHFKFLALHTLGDFARLPTGGVLVRYGREVARVHRLVTGSLAPELEPVLPEEPLAAVRELDLPICDRSELLALLHQLADPLLERLGARGQVATELTVALLPERSSQGNSRNSQANSRSTQVSPRSSRGASSSPVRTAAGVTETVETCELVLRVQSARPTLEWQRWARLLELRLASLELVPGARSIHRDGSIHSRGSIHRHALPQGVQRVTLSMQACRLPPEQAQLFQERPRRDPRACDELFANLRAAFGDEVLVRPRLIPRHLPEASFAWERLASLPPARPRALEPRRLIRRFFTPARVLPPRPQRASEGWFPLGLEHGAVIQLHGPYRSSGGWWGREVRRDAYFVELEHGAIAWLQRDEVRRRWCWQGTVA